MDKIKLNLERPMKNKFEGFDPEPRSWNFPMVINGWVHQLSGAEFKALWYVLRHTYGWQKDSDTISYNQFRFGIKKKNGIWLDRGTGLGTSALKRAIRGLVEQNFITTEQGKDEKGKWKIVRYKPQYQNPPTGERTAGREHTLQSLSSLQSLTITKKMVSPKSETPLKRKDISFKKEDYKKVIDEYQRLKGIILQGKEFEPIQQAVKTMFMSSRSVKDIIACMKWFASKNVTGDSEYIWTGGWTIKTIKLKMPEFLAGKLEKNNSIPKYEKT